MSAKEDLDALLNFLLPSAEEMLAKHGEFHPFGAFMDGDGEITAVAAEPEDDDVTAEELAESLESALRTQAEDGDVKAAGLCLDVHVEPPDQNDFDAVQTSLDHRQDDAVDVFLPYERGADGEYSFGELLATPGERPLFG